MKKKLIEIISILCVTALSLSACNLPSSVTPESDELSIAQQTIEAGVKLTDEALAQLPSATDPELPTDTEVPVEATQEPTQQVVEHLMFPGEPGSIKTWVSDISSEDYAPEKRAIGDNFAINIYERPFSSQDMEYHPHLDIVKAEVSVGDPWVYIIIHLVDSPPEAETLTYAFEADANQDGRGDVYIGGILPDSTEWTAEGAFAYIDENHDVGGEVPVSEEIPFDGWDGYETQIFDSGSGGDPDLVWIRRDPADPTKVQLAFKSYLVDPDGKFLWGVWADAGEMDPGKLDYHDHFTIEEAGSPSNSSSNYPLAALALMDNTCRWTFGFEPTGPIPGLCPLPAIPTPPPTQPPSAATPQVETPEQGTAIIIVSVFEELTNPKTTKNGEDKWMSGVTVTLSAGACPSSTASIAGFTNSLGIVTFSGRPPGTYCVNIVLPTGCGGWISNMPDPRTVTVSAGDVIGLLNGFDYNLCR